jgi:hypothetical protein
MKITKNKGSQMGQTKKYKSSHLPYVKKWLIYSKICFIGLAPVRIVDHLI